MVSGKMMVDVHFEVSSHEELTAIAAAGAAALRRTFGLVLKRVGVHFD